MTDYLTKIILGNSIQDYIIFALIIITGLVLKNIIIKSFSNIILKISKNDKDKVLKTSTEYKFENKMQLNKYIRKPMNLFIMASVIFCAFSRISFPSYWNIPTKDEFGVNMILDKSFSLIFIFSIFWILIKLSDYIGFIFTKRAERTESKLDDQVIPFAIDAIKVIIVIFGVITVISNVFLVNITALAAGLGVGGIAVAMASKESLENLFGSFTIFLDKPFTVGDVVTIGNITGNVEKVGFRSTRIRTFDRSLVTVPNKKMIDAELNNLGLRPVRRAKFIVGLTYDTSIDQIKNIVEELQSYLDKHEKTNDETKVRFMDFGSSSLDIMVLYYIKNPSWDEFVNIKQEINFEIMRIIKKHNSDFAFPSATIYHKNE